MLGSFIIFIIILTLNTVVLAPRFLLFYLSITVSPPPFDFHFLQSPPIYPPIHSCVPPVRKVKKPPMAVNKAWEIKLKKDQVSPPYIKTDLDIPLYGRGSKESIYAQGQVYSDC